ncbi:MAG: hypothetical protein ABI862_07710 [Ilumatobacteraceae bacterium]
MHARCVPRVEDDRHHTCKSVSQPGGDLTEPVSAHTQRFVQAVWALDRDLVYAHHYPAVSWRGSSSRDAGATGTWFVAHGDAEWAVSRARLLAVLSEADRIRALGGADDLSGMAGPMDGGATVACPWQTAMGVEYQRDVTIEPGAVPNVSSTARHRGDSGRLGRCREARRGRLRTIEDRPRDGRDSQASTGDHQTSRPADARAAPHTRYQAR